MRHDSQRDVSRVTHAQIDLASILQVPLRFTCSYRYCRLLSRLQTHLLLTLVVLDREERGTCYKIVVTASDERHALSAAAGFADLIDAEAD